MAQQTVMNWGPPLNEIRKMMLKLIVMNIWSSAVKKKKKKKLNENSKKFDSVKLCIKSTCLAGVI